ncbi:MAG: YjgP/YjgQ family permease [Flavobacteriaceae bacterium]|nr:YjgP/YjgQ family permease [Flavobacteriaceae bacterium]
MKILDRYILTSFLRTFFSVFIILMLVFLLQSVWLYIAELAGKDLEIDVVLKFLLYVSPRIIVLVLPLTVLLSSIMIFGRFAENYEFAAMKSTGISLQRAMRSLSIFITLLAITTYFFANNIMPWAEFNFFNLRRNLAKVKPAMVIAEGQFNQIGSINIKVEGKSGDRGQYLTDVVIHQKKSRRLGNFTVIKSNTGELTNAEDEDVLQLVLFDGNYYDALQPNELDERRKKPHVKSSFEKYILNVDLSQMNNVDLDDRQYSTRYNMLTSRELSYTIDTLKVDYQGDMEELASNMLNRSTAITLDKNIKPKKSEKKFEGDNIFELFDNKKNVQILDAALNTVNSTNAILASKEKTFFNKEKNVNKHVISFYEKYALGVSCIILFFVGAPLGALIRKGGFGLPIVIAIVLFLTYHFIGIFAKNSAEDSSMSPVLASWMSTLIMFPLSVYLTNRATKDRTLLNLDSILEPLKRLIKLKDEDDLKELELLDINSGEYKNLQGYSDEKLIDLIKNYRQYGMDETYRNTSLAIMSDRGVSEEELRFGGNLFNENYENALRYKKNFDENSRIALILYWIYIIFGIGGAVLNNNGFPAIGKIMLGIGILACLLFLFALFKAFSQQTNFYKILGANRNSNIIFVVLLGIPLYAIYHTIFRRRLKDDLKQIR